MCENWLQSVELNVILDINFKGAWSNMKSCIDPFSVLTGRPYGDGRFLCKTQPGIVYKSVACNSDGISGIEVIIGQKTVLFVLGVYLPHVGHNKECSEFYLETLHELDGRIDNCGSVSSMVMVILILGCHRPKH